MHRDVKGNKLFNISDTAFIFYQSQHLKQFKMTFLDSTKFVLTSFAREEKKRKADKHVWYYDLSIPIFSADKNTVYVELTNNCTGLCGEASYYVLKKRNGHWTIIETGMLWIS